MLTVVLLRIVAVKLEEAELLAKFAAILTPAYVLYTLYTCSTYDARGIDGTPNILIQCLHYTTTPCCTFMFVCYLLFIIVKCFFLFILTRIHYFFIRFRG